MQDPQRKTESSSRLGLRDEGNQLLADSVKH